MAENDRLRELKWYKRCVLETAGHLAYARYNNRIGELSLSAMAELIHAAESKLSVEFFSDEMYNLVDRVITTGPTVPEASRAEPSAYYLETSDDIQSGKSMILTGRSFTKKQADHLKAEIDARTISDFEILFDHKMRKMPPGWESSKILMVWKFETLCKDVSRFLDYDLAIADGGVYRLAGHTGLHTLVMLMTADGLLWTTLRSLNSFEKYKSHEGEWVTCKIGV